MISPWWRNNWRYAGTVTLAAVCGMGLGMGAFPPSTRVVEKEGPVHTVYYPQPHPPVKTIEVKQPQSCLDAIALAAALSSNSVTMSDSSGPLIDAMKDAGVALGTGDKNKMNAATEKVDKINSTTLKAKQNYAIIYPQFTAKWHQCEKESR